jgi:hypothetical protein
MKKILGIFVTAAMGVMLFSSCDPIKDKTEMTGSVTEADVKAKVVVEPVVKDGKKSNYIRLSSDGLAPCVTQFKYGVGTYSGPDAVVLGYVVPGNYNVMVTVLNADGTMLDPIAFPVTVEECYDVVPEWALLCGTGAKVWTWDERESRVWGNGGYLRDQKPTWWGVAVSDMNGQMAGNGQGATMTFSADGAILTKKRNDGVTEEGSFSFDMSKTKNKDGGGGLWSIGKLNTTGVTVLSGKAQNKGEGPVYSYDIIKLNSQEMVVAWSEDGDGAGAGGGCWYWMFRAVE